MKTIEPISKFAPGKIRVSRSALIELSPDELLFGLVRHLSGDWGELDEHDWKENEAALEHGFRLLSVYSGRNDTKFWIITEHDRSATTILLPSEY